VKMSKTKNQILKPLQNLNIYPKMRGGHRILQSNKEIQYLTPIGRSPFFGPFLEFGQAIVDAIFVQKISKFW
jgi:hypothetical protein